MSSIQNENIGHCAVFQGFFHHFCKKLSMPGISHYYLGNLLKDRRLFQTGKILKWPLKRLRIFKF